MRRSVSAQTASRSGSPLGLCLALGFVGGSVACAVALGQLPGVLPAVAGLQSGLSSVLTAFLPQHEPAYDILAEAEPESRLRVDISFPGQAEAAAPALPDEPALPLIEDSSPTADLVAPVLRIKRGETLMTILNRAGVSTLEADEAIRVLKTVYDPRRFRAGQPIELSVDAAGERRLASLSFPLGPVRTVELVRADTGYSVRNIDRPVQRETVRLAATVKDSLFGTARRVALPKEALSDMTKLLSWDIDFQRDIRPGDKFEVLVDRVVNEAGELVRNEGMLYVSLDLRDRRIEGYRYSTGDGEPGYYDRQGRALRKWLLRTPVDGARLSSTFGPRRHPILGFTRMHKGIDFAAPAGTPIFAASDGEIEVIGRNRGHGKYIRIRHNGEFASAYAHLSRFGNGLKPGSKVKQGQVIGYVGSTGLSTGPHLHYEVLQNGAQVNPLGLKQTMAVALEGAELRRFQQRRSEIDTLRHGLAGEQMVAQTSH